MQTAQQVLPISALREQQAAVLDMADKAPVILVQDNKPRAVLVSVEQWDAIALELRNLKLGLEARRIEEETLPDEWVTDEELDRTIAEKFSHK
ncbi:MAG: type II toxin-antitoxin system prevent-host-death family antitoxin [Caldilineaceae bacterium]